MYDRFPPGRQFVSGPLQVTCLIHQRQRAPVEHLSRRREDGFTSLNFERFHAKQGFHFLDRIGNGGLAFEQRFRCLSVPACVHHCNQ